MIESVVDDKMTGSAGVENGVVGILDTGVIEVGSGECMCMKGSAVGGFVFAFCPLMGYSIVDIEVADVLGGLWPVVRADKDEWVVAGIGRIKTHPLTPWVISILCILGLSGNMGDFHQSGKTVKEGRWGSVD